MKNVDIKVFDLHVESPEYAKVVCDMHARTGGRAPGYMDLIHIRYSRVHPLEVGVQ